MSTTAIIKPEPAKLPVPPARSPKLQRKTPNGTATYGGTHVLLNPTTTLCGIYYSDDPKAQFYRTCKVVSENPKCPSCAYEVRRQRPATSPSIVIPMADEWQTVNLLTDMTDQQLVRIHKASKKLDGFVLAELRVRFDKNGRIDGYESCETWTAVLKALDIPERTARHRIARSGLDNPAKKHDGSKSRKPKPTSKKVEIGPSALDHEVAAERYSPGSENLNETEPLLIDTAVHSILNYAEKTLLGFDNNSKGIAYHAIEEWADSHLEKVNYGIPPQPETAPVLSGVKP